MQATHERMIASTSLCMEDAEVNMFSLYLLTLLLMFQQHRCN